MNKSIIIKTFDTHIALNHKLSISTERSLYYIQNTKNKRKTITNKTIRSKQAKRKLMPFLLKNLSHKNQYKNQ